MCTFRGQPHSSPKIFGLRWSQKPAFVASLQEKKRTHKRTLKVERYNVGRIQPLSDALIQEYMDNLAELARKDRDRVLLEEAKNKLESYIYHVNNKLMDDEENIAKISTEEQREELSRLSREAEDWLFDEGDTATVETLGAKLADLTGPAEKVWFRLREATQRPAAVKALREKLTSIEENFTKWVSNMTHITEEERGDVFEKIETARKWLSDREGEQAERAPHEAPAFTSDEVPLQTNPIAKLVDRLARKPPPKVKKNETAGEKATNATSEGGSNNETSTAGNSSGEGETTTKSEAKEEKKEAKDDEKGEEPTSVDEEL
jgi:hypoxia up-regulated 1